MRWFRRLNPLRWLRTTGYRACYTKQCAKLSRLLAISNADQTALSPRTVPMSPSCERRAIDRVLGQQMARRIGTYAFRFALAILLYASGSCDREGTSKLESPILIPSVSAELSGPPEPVLDTRDGCDDVDVPDAFPHAFRDAQNSVHLIASHWVTRALIGPSLDQLKRDCHVVYRSSHDRDPAHFRDENWLTSFYTEDGLRVGALVHSEYHGFEHDGMCGDPQSPRRADDCAWTEITFAESRDGGNVFEEATPPTNLVASLPYPYDKENKSGPQGYNSPTNILKIGNFYYAMINVWREYKAQRYGPCLIRTDNLFNPSSWRAWDGKDFRIRFVDPYMKQKDNPADHVCPPVILGTLDSLAIDEQSGIFLADVYVKDDRYGQGSGLYITASRDLVRWSVPKLVASTNSMLRHEPPGNWSYLYFTIIDPEAKDRNFTAVSNTPYVYYVRFDDNHPPYARVLFRQRIKISVRQ